MSDRETERLAMAETIHKARWPADRQMAVTPFADEDRNGREYCLRIADAVLAHARGYAQTPPDERLPNDFIATALLTTLDVMKSAKRKGVSMEVWDRDIEAVEAAVRALQSPDTSTLRLCPDCGRSIDGPTHAAYCADTRPDRKCK